MIINSKRFGTMEVKDDKVIQFQTGILGFPHLKKFFLADDPADEAMPFKWLIPVDEPEITFLVTDPGIFFSDYAFDLPEEDRKKIEATSEDDVSVLTILTVPEEPKKITANLRGPLVVNWRTMIGRQVILKDTNYQTKHFIFIQDSVEEKAAVKQATAQETVTIPPQALNTSIPTEGVRQS